MPLLKPTTIDPTVGIELEFDIALLTSLRADNKIREFAAMLIHISNIPGFKEWYASVNYSAMGYSSGSIIKLPMEGTIEERIIKLVAFGINYNNFVNRFCQDFFYYYLVNRSHTGVGGNTFSPILSLKKDGNYIPFLSETKHCQDGGGIEYSFPPRKLDFYAENKFIFENVESVMGKITDCPESRCAGMHVHLGLDTFKQFGLLNFILFFYKNAKFIKKFAGRANNHSYVQAGEFIPEANVTSASPNKSLKVLKAVDHINREGFERLISQVFDYKSSYLLGNYTNHTSDAPFLYRKRDFTDVIIQNNSRALFAICRKNYPTIECRIFQATASADVVYSRIEFLTALKNYCHTLYNYGQEAAVEKDITKLDFDYINDHLVDDLDINKFYQYLLTNPAKYSHIINDLNTNYKEFFETPLIESTVSISTVVEEAPVKKSRRTKSQIISQEETV